MKRAWKVHERANESAAEIAKRLGVSPITGHLLCQRGFDDVERAKAFMEPRLADLHDPRDLPNMDAATERLQRAIEDQETILLFGDYDVDGTTGAAVLQQVLCELGGQVEVHIPDRTEGYGVNVPRLERAAAEGVTVVVTIDNGIAAVDELARARELGLDVIVADHHTMGEALPEAVALVHPRLEGSTYPNPHLCGAGVAFKLAWATCARVNGDAIPARQRDLLLACMSLVALGTVADVVPLVGENRIIVRYGLLALERKPAVGPAALLSLARVEGDLSATDVAFKLAPRLNAAGRMGRAGRSFDLLTATDPEEAKRLAKELDQENQRRRTLQARVVDAAKAQVEEVYGATPTAAGLVVWGDDWPHGVVGIVAAKLTETYQRPALVVSIEGETAKGSGRTRGDVDLLAALEVASPHLTRFGGHAAAVGFSLDATALPALREAFEKGVRQAVGASDDADPREVAARLDGYEVVADVEVRLDEVSRQLLAELDRLSPFGEGNDEPVFVSRDVTLAGEPRLMGKTGNHVSFRIRQGKQVLRTVAFGRPDLWDSLRERALPGPHGQSTFHVAFQPRINRWNGSERLELELKALRFSDPVADAPDPRS
jgi:single-stranded-DNA-specific exonuclease